MSALMSRDDSPNDKECKDGHHDCCDPGDYIVPASIYVTAHEAAIITKQYHKHSDHQFSFTMAQRMALPLLCCLPKKLDAKEREDLGEQVEDGQSADHDGQRVGHHIVSKAIRIASHQPFLVHQVQNSKQNDREQEAVEQIEVEQNLNDRQIWQHGDHHPNQNEDGKQPPEERSLVPRSSHAPFKPKRF